MNLDLHASDLVCRGRKTIKRSCFHSNCSLRCGRWGGAGAVLPKASHVATEDTISFGPPRTAFLDAAEGPNPTD